jgi:transposase
MTYSVHFRKKVLKIKEIEKLSYAEVAKKFSISKTTILRWEKKIDPQKTRNRKPSKIDMEALKKDIEQYPDSYYYERAQRLGGITTSGVRDAIYRLGVSYKKNSKSPKSRSAKERNFLPRGSKIKV